LELSVTSQAQHRALMAHAVSGIAAAPLRSVEMPLMGQKGEMP
jgi:hypothetical protein